MRKTWCAAFVVCLVLGPARAEDKGEPMALVNKAIKAAGGADKLTKFQAQTWKEKGTYYGMGEGLPYTATNAVQWPDKYSMNIHGYFVIVLNGNKGWMKPEGAEAMEMQKEQLEEQMESHYGGWVSTLVPLKGKGFTLTALDETKVDGKPASGIKIAHKGHGDVSLWFDKDSGLLVKSAQRLKSAQQGGKEVLHEGFFSNYQAVQGVQIPMKIVVHQDGKKLVEAENHDVKLAEKLDDKTFAKP